jgi:uncharacterized protein with HEPN domain
MRDDKERLLDIQEQIALIEEDVQLGREAFDKDRHIRDSMAFRIANLGEACRAMSERFKTAHSEIPWKEIIGMRAKLSHEYFQIDPNEVWNTAERDIPDLRRQIETILSGMS